MAEETQEMLSSVLEKLEDKEIALETVLDDVGDLLLQMFEADRIVLYNICKSSPWNELKPSSCVGRGATRGLNVTLRLGKRSLAGYSASTEQALAVEDMLDSEQIASIDPELRIDRSVDEATNTVTRAVMLAPGVLDNGEVAGVLEVAVCDGSDKSYFTDEEIDIARKVADEIFKYAQSSGKYGQGPFGLLVNEGWVTDERLDEIANYVNENGGFLTRVLAEEEGVPVEKIGESLEQYFGVPFMQYDPNIDIQNRCLQQLNQNYLIRKRWLPIADNDGVATILIDNPYDWDRIMEIQGSVDAKSYEYRVGLPEDILRFLGVRDVDLSELAEMPAEEEDEASVTSIDDLVGQLQEEEQKQEDTRQKQEVSELEEEADEEAPVIVQLVDKVVKEAVNSDASDIHIEPRKDAPGKVRYRVDGVCRDEFDIPQSHTLPVVARIKVMAGLDIAESRLPQDGKMRVNIKGEDHELRVVTVPTVFGESVVLRVLTATEPIPFDKLNLSPRNYRLIDDRIQYPHGIFLVVGPTGSGKTTTLHAMLARINTPEKKIWTAEDPVEITQPGLQQCQIKRGIGFDFAGALRSFLRADPDVILIGEMRDYETAHTGIEASLTGHLVFSTLHTNSAPETVTRLLDIGLDPLNFADAFIGVLAQRLVRTLCKKCKEAYQPDRDELEHLVRIYGAESVEEMLRSQQNSGTLYKPVGCENCGYTGYRGRTGVHEFLVATSELKQLITLNKGVHEIREQAQKDGMNTLMQDGVEKILQGQTDLAQLRKVAVSEE